MKRKRSNIDEIIASVFFKYNEIEYVGAIVVPVKNLSEKQVREQGYRFVDSVIRTLRKNGALILK